MIFNSLQILRNIVISPLFKIDFIKIGSDYDWSHHFHSDIPGQY